MDRKARLRELDGILDDLEMLNLNDRTEVPPCLAEHLACFGIASNRPIPQLIEEVWACQEPSMLPFVQPTRWGGRRRKPLNASGAATSSGSASALLGREVRQRRRNAELMRRWYWRHVEAIRAKRQRWYAEHRDEEKARVRRWYRAHRDEDLSRQRARRRDAQSASSSSIRAATCAL